MMMMMMMMMGFMKIIRMSSKANGERWGSILDELSQCIEISIQDALIFNGDDSIFDIHITAFSLTWLIF